MISTVKYNFHSNIKSFSYSSVYYKYENVFFHSKCRNQLAFHPHKNCEIYNTILIQVIVNLVVLTKYTFYLIDTSRESKGKYSHHMLPLNSIKYKYILIWIT